MSSSLGTGHGLPAWRGRADGYYTAKIEKQAQKTEGLLQVCQQHGVQENREATKFPVRERFDSTTEPPTPTNQASRCREMRQVPIGRKTARRLGHPMATPQAQQSMYESVIHAFLPMRVQPGEMIYVARSLPVRCLWRQTVSLATYSVCRAERSVRTDRLLAARFYKLAAVEKRPN